jgi:hypothetical protein
MALLGHGMKCVGLFDKEGSVQIGLAELSKTLSLGQYREKAAAGLCADDGEIDGFSETRLGRWINEPNAAGWKLDATLDIWDNGAFGGSVDAFRHGPAKSLLFDALAEPIESEEFFQAADISFQRLCDQIANYNRLSGHIRNRLDEICDEAGSSPESVLKYLAATVAWFRYASVTLHSVDYVLDHLNKALESCDRIERRVHVGQNGIVSYPIDTDEFRRYLIQMTLNLARFKSKLIDSVPETGGNTKAYWQKLAKDLVVR